MFKLYKEYKKHYKREKISKISEDSLPVEKLLFEYPKTLPTVLLTALIVRYCTTYSVVQRERSNAEVLHARNYQLIVFAKDHPGFSINDFLTTAYLPTPRVVAMLKWLEKNSRFKCDHRIPPQLKRPAQEINERLTLP